MLVLSRRETEKVLFPTLGISIEVLRVSGRKARLGIDAPPDIPVLRHEITDRQPFDLTPDGAHTRQQLRDMAQVVRRRLDSAATALNRLHQKLADENDQTGQEIVLRLFQDLQCLEDEANQALEWSNAAKGLHVLIVEDSAFERTLLASLLEISGFNVTTAADGQEALDYLSLHAQPDAVLLDMLMPRCDGPEFVRQVRADSKFEKLRIYAASAHDPSKLGLVIGYGGVDGWFPKPLNAEELISALDPRLSKVAAA